MAAVEALAGLLPHLPVADAWNCLQQLVQALTQQACRSGPSEPCIARLTALRRCAEALLHAHASLGTDEGGAEGCAELTRQAQVQAERPQAQTEPLQDASTDAGRQTQAQLELPPDLAASECAAWQQRAASLIVPALEFCAAHLDFAVQQVRCCRSMLAALCHRALQAARHHQQLAPSPPLPAQSPHGVVLAAWLYAGNGDAAAWTAAPRAPHHSQGACAAPDRAAGSARQLEGAGGCGERIARRGGGSGPALQQRKRAEVQRSVGRGQHSSGYTCR